MSLWILGSFTVHGLNEVNIAKLYKVYDDTEAGYKTHVYEENELIKLYKQSKKNAGGNFIVKRGKLDISGDDNLHFREVEFISVIKTKREDLSYGDQIAAAKASLINAPFFSPEYNRLNWLFERCSRGEYIDLKYINLNYDSLLDISVGWVPMANAHRGVDWWLLETLTIIGKVDNDFVGMNVRGEFHFIDPILLPYMTEWETFNRQYKEQLLTYSETIHRYLLPMIPDFEFRVIGITNIKADGTRRGFPYWYEEDEKNEKLPFKQLEIDRNSIEYKRFLECKRINQLNSVTDAGWYLDYLFGFFLVPGRNHLNIRLKWAPNFAFWGTFYSDRDEHTIECLDVQTGPRSAADMGASALVSVLDFRAPDTLQVFDGYSTEKAFNIDFSRCKNLISIEDCGFALNKRIKEIKLPDTVQHLGADMLSCSSIEKINIPQSITDLDVSTFENGGVLKEVILPDYPPLNLIDSNTGDLKCPVRVLSGDWEVGSNQKLVLETGPDNIEFAQIIKRREGFPNNIQISVRRS